MIKSKKTFKHYEKMIQKLTWSFVYRNVGLEFEETFAEACLAFAQAYRTFNSDRSQMTTYVYNVVKNHLIDYIAKHYRLKRCSMQRVDVDLQNHDGENKPSSLITYCNPERALQFLEQIERLRPKTRSLCQLILEAPNDFLGLTQAELRNHIERLGWTKTQAKRSIVEIKTML